MAWLTWQDRLCRLQTRSWRIRQQRMTMIYLPWSSYYLCAGFRPRLQINLMSWEAMEVCMSKTRRGKYTDNRICYISKCKGDMRLYWRRKGKLPCFSYLVRGKSFSFYRVKVLLFIGKHVPCDDDLLVIMPDGPSTDFRTRAKKYLYCCLDKPPDHVV